MTLRHALVLTAAITTIASTATRVAAEDWPQFRGPNGSGISTSRGLPLEFSQQKNVLWQATLGDGIGSPVISQGRVFTTAMPAPKQFVVYCHQAATGKLLWKREVATGELPRITPPNSHASSTPATDGKRVFVYVSTLGLLGFDAATGKQLWTHPLPRPAYLMDWGAGASPIVYRDLVIYCQDDDLNPHLVAVDAATGKLRWRTPRPDMLAGYAVPVLCEANGRTDLVVAGSGKMKGYDPATGQERWTCNTLLRTIMTSPVVKDGVIYLAVQSYGDSKRTLKFALLEWLDTNQDGKLARAEMPKEFLERFDRSDTDKNGFIEGPELDTAFQHESNQAGGGSTVQAIRGGGTGDVTKTHLLWNISNRAPSNLSSLLVVGERIYIVKAGGLSSCFSTGDGKTVWELERLKNLGDYYASPVFADGKVYIAAKNGFVLVLADGPKLEVLARNDMGGEILATPAIADGRLFIRTRERLYCVGNPIKPTPPRAGTPTKPKATPAKPATRSTLRKALSHLDTHVPVGASAVIALSLGPDEFSPTRKQPLPTTSIPPHRERTKGDAGDSALTTRPINLAPSPSPNRRIPAPPPPPLPLSASERGPGDEVFDTAIPAPPPPLLPLAASERGPGGEVFDTANLRKQWSPKGSRAPRGHCSLPSAHTLLLSTTTFPPYRGGTEEGAGDRAPASRPAHPRSILTHAVPVPVREDTPTLTLHPA